MEIKLKRTKDKKKKGAAKVGTQNMRKKKRKKSRRSSLKVDEMNTSKKRNLLSTARFHLTATSFSSPSKLLKVNQIPIFFF